MKITDVRVNLVAIPLASPYPLSEVYGTLTHARALVLRLETDDGLVGLGEANPQPPFTEEAPEGALAILTERIAPALLGLDADSVGAVLARLERVLTGNPTVKAAVDMALHDLLGKALGVPASRLLGGALRSEVPVLWPLGAVAASENVPVVEAKLEAGYESFMIKLGSRPVDEEIADVETLLTRFADRAAFIVDANQGWTVADALRFAAASRAWPVRLIEQPVAHHDHAGLRRVRETAYAPVSADESVQSMEDAVRLATAGAVDVFSIKVSKNGGLAQARRIAEIGAAFGMRCLMNSMIELGISQAASLQLGVTLSNLLDVGHAYMSTLRTSDDVTDFSGLVSRGVAKVSERPGLGVELDADRLDRYTVAHAHVR